MSSAAFSGDPFDALGDPHRRAIVELLANRSRSVQELADELPISRPAVSRHLRLLKEAGLVADEPRAMIGLALAVEARATHRASDWADPLTQQASVNAAGEFPSSEDASERYCEVPLRTRDTGQAPSPWVTLATAASNASPASGRGPASGAGFVGR